jgi:hypothetical protein
MHSLEIQMRQRIAAGLQRRTLTTASRWAEKCRMMGPPYPGKWTFKWHPWLKEMHDSSGELNIGQKSAQMGYTETVLNLTFFHIDVKGVDCLYVLPSKTPDASDFSSGRFDPALELSPHLANLFSDVKNIGHKRAGSANLYVRGSKSRGGLKSVPVGFIVLDEVDEMNQHNIPLALERTSGQVDWQAWMISTPTLPDTGINKYFTGSTQEHFFYKCPGCSRLTDLTFPECLEITAEEKDDPRIEQSFLKCRECRVKLIHETKCEWLVDGQWVETVSNRNNRGFHINQMYSSTVRPVKLARAYLAGLTDPSDETEFWNSSMGMPYKVKGAQLSMEEINQHIQAYANGKMRPRSLVTMGVDVGKFLHVTIEDWQYGQIHGVDFNTDAIPRVLLIEKVTEFNDLDRLMKEWGISMCVIDAHPERRQALQFANRFFGSVRLCIYAQGVHGKEIKVSQEDDQIVHVDRTSWLDLSLSRFRRDEMIAIPQNTPLEYKQHLMVPIRVYKKDKIGTKIGYYDSRDLDDHYAHSRVYSEIAFKLGARIIVNRNIQSPA